MYKILTLFSFLLTTQFLSAQTAEGRLLYRVTHNWAKKMETLDYISKQEKERISYSYNKNNQWSYFMELYFTPTQSKYTDSEEVADGRYMGWSSRKKTFFVKRDFSAKTLHDVLMINNKSYVIRDSLSLPRWKIGNNIKEVAGHVCMDAELTDTLKDQHIVAWFALDLAIPAGPERFCGLPGLILELDINDGALKFVAEKLELRPLTAELDLPKKVKGKEVNEAGYMAKLREFIEEQKEQEIPWFYGVRY